MKVDFFLDASTGYITYEDSLKLLDAHEAFPTRVIPREYGWWINVNCFELSGEEGKFQELKEDGYSDAFINLIKLASKNGCWWINLDCAGEEVDGLEQNEW